VGRHDQSKDHPVGRCQSGLSATLCDTSGMRNSIVGLTLSLCVLVAGSALAQSLSPHWEELTAEDFVAAVQRANGTCVLPFGIIEKHGPSGPLGTDLINIRYTVEKAVQDEYAVVFPAYYVGETVSEMARNGCSKIVIANGHGGNNGLLQYFNLTLLEKPHDYVVYTYAGTGGNAQDLPAAARASKPGADGHAGEGEVSNVMTSRPDLGHPERAGRESGGNMARLALPAGVTTSISWYSMYPNHYAGDASGATATRGAAMAEYAATHFAVAIRAIKADQVSAQLQKEFFEKAAHPLDTKQ
jgi:creatinine amidohydrolase